MVVKYEFMAALQVLYIFEAVYEAILLCPYIRNKRNVLGNFKVVAYGMFASCLLGACVKWLEMASDSRLLGLCPLYGISITLTGPELLVYQGTLCYICRLSWLLAQGHSSSRICMLGFKPCTYAVASVIIIAIFSFTIAVIFLKECSKSEDRRLWAALELQNGFFLVNSYLFLCVWTARTARTMQLRSSESSKASNLAQIHKGFLNTVIRICCGWLIAWPILVVTTLLQVFIVTTDKLHVLAEWLDCVFCFTFWMCIITTRATIIRGICVNRSSAEIFASWIKMLDVGVAARLLAEDLGHPSKVVSDGLGKCRVVRFSHLDADCFRTSEGTSELEFKGKSERTFVESQTAASPDIFVSHSWRDDPDEKWIALQQIAAMFEMEHGYEPTLWIDRFCIDQLSISLSLRYLPVFVAASKKVAVLYGQSYFSRLWCVWELFVVSLTVGLGNVIFLAIPPQTLLDTESDLSRFVVANCGCFQQVDKDNIMNAIDSFRGGVKSFEGDIRRFGKEISLQVEESELGRISRASILSWSQTPRSRRASKNCLADFAITMSGDQRRWSSKLLPQVIPSHYKDLEPHAADPSSQLAGMDIVDNDETIGGNGNPTRSQHDDDHDGDQLRHCSMDGGEEPSHAGTKPIVREAQLLGANYRPILSIEPRFPECADCVAPPPPSFESLNRMML